METQATIVGVHPIEGEESVFLIELLVEGNLDRFDMGEVTQEAEGQPRSNWQAAYDERTLERSARQLRVAFFFHYLDLAKPLLTPVGSLPLPKLTSMPNRLSGIVYESP